MLRNFPLLEAADGVTPEQAICTMQSHPVRQCLPDWPIYHELVVDRIAPSQVLILTFYLGRTLLAWCWTAKESGFSD
jgi:hypothetical protein